MNKKPFGARNTAAPLLSLFASAGTLVCCALPALLVSIGAGAALAGIVSAVPWLIAFSIYKAWTFAVSGALIVLAGYSLWCTRNLACPVDPAKALLCKRLRKLSQFIYGLSIIVWLIGFFFAFLAADIFY